MKKIFASLLAAALCMGLAGCGLLERQETGPGSSLSSDKEIMVPIGDSSGQLPEESSLSSEEGSSLPPESESEEPSKGESGAVSAPQEGEDPLLGPVGLLDLTSLLVKGEETPTALRFLDNDTLALQCSLGSEYSCRFYGISENRLLEEDLDMDLNYPNSYDRIVELEGGGNIRITEDQTQVVRVFPDGEERVLLDAAAEEGVDSFWIILAKGRWAAVCGNTMKYEPSAFFLDLEEGTAERLPIDGTVLPGDIRGEKILFLRESTSFAGNDAFLYLCHGESKDLTPVYVGTELGASRCVMSGGGEYLLALTAVDEEADTAEFALFDGGSGVLQKQFSLDGLSRITDSMAAMAISPDGKTMAAMTYATPGDYVHCQVFLCPIP